MVENIVQSGFIRQGSFSNYFSLSPLVGDDKRMTAVGKILGKGQIKSDSLHAIDLFGNSQTQRKGRMKSRKRMRPSLLPAGSIKLYFQRP